MEWMLMPLKRYAEFSGRSRRKEYWMFTLFMVLVIAALMFVTGLLGGFTDTDDTQPGGAVFLLLLIGFVLATAIPSIAVTVRRLHDQDKSGWFYLISLVPYVGGIIMFVFMCIDGTHGSNQYGPDPKGGHSDIFA